MFVNVLRLVLCALVIEEFAAQCPERCSCVPDEHMSLGVVNCSGIGLMAFPTEVNAEVKCLDLSHNKIRALPPLLDKWIELEVLIVAGNRIANLPAGAFSRLRHLRYLDLSNNAIRGSLKQLSSSLPTSLTYLDLSKNPLYTFPPLPPSLITLKLSSCDLMFLPDGKHLQLPRTLKNLDLSHNPLKWLDDLTAPNLTTLNLEGCALDTMSPNALYKLPLLSSLKISNNPEFDLNYRNLTSASLQVFEAAYCSVTRPGLYAMPNLTMANLRGNKISVLPARVFVKNKLLVELDLSLNEIKSLSPFAFVATRSLAFLNLSNNAISELPWDVFSTSHNLRTLVISENPRLSSLGNLSALVLSYLDVSRCGIRGIARDSLVGLPWLRTLNLSGNPLERLSDDIQSWYLQNLDLSYCRLTAVNNETFRRFPELAVLDLTGNRLTDPESFPIEALDSSESLERVLLADNPWICNCSSPRFRALYEFLSAGNPPRLPPAEQNKVHCMSPKQLAGKPWLVACYSTWHPVVDTPISPGDVFTVGNVGSVAVVVIITGVGVFLIVSTIRRRIRARLKAEREAVLLEGRRVLEAQTRIALQRLQRDDPSPPTRHEPPRRHERTPSEITLPPSYDEAVRMIQEQASNEEDGEGDTAPLAVPESGTESANENSDSDPDLPGPSVPRKNTV